MRDIFIGLDLGNDTGFAVVDSKGRRLESGTWQLKPTDKELPAARWINFAKSLRTLIAKYKAPGVRLTVSYEYAPYQKGHVAAFVYGGWLAMLEIAEAEHGKQVTWQRIGVHEWKTILTGSGRAKKPEYIKAVNARFGLKNKNKKGLGGEDECAALGVAYAAAKKL